MVRAWVVPAGAGILSALLYMAVALGTQGAVMLILLTPLPLFAMGLGGGLIGATIAGTLATALVGLTVGLIPAATFAALVAGPVLILVRQALLSRLDATGTLEWYPPGRLVAWLTGMGAALFLAAALFLSSGRSLEERLRSVLNTAASGYGVDSPATLVRSTIEWLAAYPSLMVLYWLTALVINGILAQGLLVRFARNLRPSPPVATIELPRSFGPAVALALGLWVLGDGWLAFVGRNLMMLLGFGFFFAGLGVVHFWLQRLVLRQAALVGFYVLLAFGWSVLLVSALGFIDHWAHFRRRFGGSTADRA